MQFHLFIWGESVVENQVFMIIKLDVASSTVSSFEILNFFLRHLSL